MRIVIVATPKAGNHWLACLLSRTYRLHWLGEGLGRSDPADQRPKFRAWAAAGGFAAGRGNHAQAFVAWAAAGGFPDGSLFHQHRRFDPGLADAIEAVPARLVTIVRDPYDAFVSLYHWAQEKAARAPRGAAPRPRDRLVGKPLDHPDVLAYLADEFRRNLALAAGWLRSGRAVVVRYEGLHRDPVGELTGATERIAPVERERVEAAVEACRAEHMRRMSEKLAWHVRSATVGDAANHLTEAHLAVFRERHAAVIRALGYEVR